MERERTSSSQGSGHKTMGIPEYRTMTARIQLNSKAKKTAPQQNPSANPRRGLALGRDSVSGTSAIQPARPRSGDGKETARRTPDAAAGRSLRPTSRALPASGLRV